MHILFAAWYYFANPDLVRLSAELAKRKHRVSVVTSFRTFDKHTYGKGVDLFEIKPLITIHAIPYLLLFPFSKIYKLVKERDVEIIHAVMDSSLHTATAAFVSKMTGVPFVYTMQAMGTRTDHPLVDTVARFYDRTIERFVLKRAKKVILLSKRLVSVARKLGVEESKIVIIPSGVDYTYFDPKRSEIVKKAAMLRNDLNLNNKIVIGYVGRLAPQKGLTYLISAIKQVQKKHPNIVLLLVGEGPQKAKLETMSKNLKIETIFTGWQADVSPFYAIMDIFVLPSLYEGLPNVILEAMAMERSVIATNVGGNGDLIENGLNGYLVPSRNVDLLARRILTLCEKNDLRAVMGSANRKKIQQLFTWDRVIEQVEAVYEKALLRI